MQKIPHLPPGFKITPGIVLLIFLAVILAFISGGLLWAWPFMVIAGSSGWHIGYGTAIPIGMGIALLVGACRGK